MTLWDVLTTFVEQYGLDVDDLTVAEFVNGRQLDAETPIPVWNESAQAWEV